MDRISCHIQVLMLNDRFQMEHIQRNQIHAVFIYNFIHQHIFGRKKIRRRLFVGIFPESRFGDCSNFSPKNEFHFSYSHKTNFGKRHWKIVQFFIPIWNWLWRMQQFLLLLSKLKHFMYILNKKCCACCAVVASSGHQRNCRTLYFIVNCVRVQSVTYRAYCALHIHIVCGLVQQIANSKQ